MSCGALRNVHANESQGARTAAHKTEAPEANITSKRRHTREYRGGEGVRAGEGVEAGEGAEAGEGIKAGEGVEADEGTGAGEGVKDGEGDRLERVLRLTRALRLARMLDERKSGLATASRGRRGLRGHRGWRGSQGWRGNQGWRQFSCGFCHIIRPETLIVKRPRNRGRYSGLPAREIYRALQMAHTERKMHTNVTCVKRGDRLRRRNENISSTQFRYARDNFEDELLGAWDLLEGNAC